MEQLRFVKMGGAPSGAADRTISSISISPASRSGERSTCRGARYSAQSSKARSGRDRRRDRTRDAHLRQSVLKVIRELEQRRAHPSIDPKRYTKPRRVHVRQHGALERDTGTTGTVLEGHQPYPEDERRGEHAERRDEQLDCGREFGQGRLEPDPRMHARAKHGIGLERCRGRAAHPVSRNQPQSP